MTNFTTARRNLVESQLRASAILEPRLLAAAGSVPREHFLAKELQALAYGETHIPIAPGRYMLAPLCQGVLLQAAEIKADDAILVVGAGDGYMGALAAKLGGVVIGLESDPALSARAADLLTEYGIDNIALVEGDLAAGCAKQAPYDVIVLNGATQTGVESLLAQLNDGGRLVCVEYENGVGRARIYRRDGDACAGRTVRDLSAPLLPGFERAAAFSFS
ncbi:MAG: protein-L-isoaspartate O-methyltransferase [Alphaproteobacteria bacterium]|nr:protein-L-isoaspartate O-methyltransferase [Alphaproteobacteria bacterium]